MLYQQIINLLTVPPGNLVYHLVLAFSIAGALPGALNLWQRGGLVEDRRVYSSTVEPVPHKVRDRMVYSSIVEPVPPKVRDRRAYSSIVEPVPHKVRDRRVYSSTVGRRMVIGLCLLLAAQFILIIDAGLAPFFPTFEVWLPILDRAINAFSLSILIWLWIFPQPSRRADSATLLIGLFILFFAVLSGLWWQNQSAYSFFNGSPADLLWAGISLVLALAGGLLLVIRRPDGYGIGLGMFSLLFLGQLLYLFNPLPDGNFPGVVRLTQIAAYPLLLTLPSRFSPGDEIERITPIGVAPEIYQSLNTILTSPEPLVVCQAVTKLVSHSLSADLCLLISPPDATKHVSVQCGYDLSRQERIGAATFDSNLIPVLSEALRQGRPLHLPAEANIPDLVGFEKILNLSISGSLLSAPIFTKNGDLDKALVLLSPYSERSWTENDQNYLADIASYLTEIFEFKKKFLTQGNKLAQSNITLQNIQAENDRLDNEIIDLTSRYNDSVEKKNQLRAELDKALKEIDSMRTSQPQKKGLPE